MKTNHGTVSSTTVREAQCNRCDYSSIVSSVSVGISVLAAHYDEKHNLEFAINGIVDKFDWEEESNAALVSEIMAAVMEDRQYRDEAREAKNVDRPNPDVLKATLAGGLIANSAYYSLHRSDARSLAAILARLISEVLA